jgi:hypothetical protein
VAELIALGMVTLQKMLQWIIRSQVLRICNGSMDAVHRLNGSGCALNTACLRYSRSCRESGLADKGIWSLNFKTVARSRQVQVK